jgi:S1-C subfamily serine protease
MSDVLQSLSHELAALTEKAGASVVRVEGRRRLPATGVIYAPGIVVTANHVVERDEDLVVGLPDGKTVPATLAGRDPSTDLAVLRAETGNAPAATWVDPSELKVGHLVLALGRPAESIMATLGVISALEDGSKLPSEMQIDTWLQTDVVMYPGFSGGPLVGADGKLLGINSSALMRGISLAVPAPTIRRVADTLLQHGKMKRGFLGVGAQAAKLPRALAERLGQEMGLIVMTVEPGSPADQGGLYMGDTLVALDGHPLREPEALIRALTGDMIGKKVVLKVVRSGELREIAVTIGERK